MKPLIVIFFYFIISIALISCSNDDTDSNKSDHTHPDNIDMVKHLFEHEFAQQCVASETANLVEKADGQKRFAESCMCIARYLFKDLTAKDSYTLLNDKKHAKSLRKKYEEAAKYCV